MKNDTLDRSDILRLAAESGLGVRTVKRAVEKGVSALHAAVDQQRLRDAAVKLGIKVKP
jgi:hypothetical protein